MAQGGADPRTVFGTNSKVSANIFSIDIPRAKVAGVMVEAESGRRPQRSGERLASTCFPLCSLL